MVFDSDYFGQDASCRFFLPANLFFIRRAATPSIVFCAQISSTTRLLLFSRRTSLPETRANIAFEVGFVSDGKLQ
jgi:hypothetical protein